MKVKLLVGRAGASGDSNVAGDVIDVDSAEGERLIASGAAERIGKAPKETATAEPPETAADTSSARRRRGGASES